MADYSAEKIIFALIVIPIVGYGLFAFLKAKFAGKDQWPFKAGNLKL